MGAHPIDAQARQRLREAQQAEARALRAVTSAEHHRMEAKARLDAAERDVEAALLDLVRVSGDERAAMLTATPVTTLRRIKRHARGRRPGPPKRLKRSRLSTERTTARPVASERGRCTS